MKIPCLAPQIHTELGNGSIHTWTRSNALGERAHPCPSSPLCNHPCVFSLFSTPFRLPPPSLPPTFLVNGTPRRCERKPPNCRLRPHLLKMYDRFPPICIKSWISVGCSEINTTRKSFVKTVTVSRRPQGQLHWRAPNSDIKQTQGSEEVFGGAVLTACLLPSMNTKYSGGGREGGRREGGSLKP